MKRYNGKYACSNTKEISKRMKQERKKNAHATSPKGYTSVTVGGTPTDAATQEASPEVVILN